MEFDKTSYYYFDTSAAVPHSHGCGRTKVLEKKPSVFGSILGEIPTYTFVMEVNPNCNVKFTDISGKSFTPTIERIFAHEMGHGYVYLLHGPFSTSSITKHLYHKAVGYENIISRELDKHAPERAVTDHGDPMGRYRDF
jgi:hypothetical protein